MYSLQFDLSIAVNWMNNELLLGEISIKKYYDDTFV